MLSVKNPLTQGKRGFDGASCLSAISAYLSGVLLLNFFSFMLFHTTLWNKRSAYLRGGAEVFEVSEGVK